MARDGFLVVYVGVRLYYTEWYVWQCKGGRMRVMARDGFLVVYVGFRLVLY